jgi:hypothetical protein
MSEIASAYVSILPSTRGFGSNLTSQTSGEVGNAGGFLGGLLGKGMLAGFAAVGVAAGVGVELYKIGSSFDNLSDTIRINTGKSGKALEALDSIAQTVGQNVPVAFDQVGPVVADLNRRLNLTGEPLEKLSEQFLNLGHITGEQIDIPTVTGALNAFSVKSGDTGKVLDELFQVTQSTGISFGDLASTLQSNGPTLAQFGLSAKQSAVLIGNLDKAGIDSSRTLATMRTGLANFAKAGKDPQKALKDTITQIGAFVKKGDEAGAVNVAAKIFGTRGAAQFVAAVKSGRLSVDQLTKANTGSKDTINKAEKATADFAERWQMFKNRVLVSLEPIATKVFDAISKGSAKLGPAIRQGIAKASPVLKQLAADAVPFVTALKTQFLPVLQTIANSIQTKLLPAATSLGNYLVTKWGPVFVQIGGIIRNQVLPILASVASFMYGKFYPALLQIYTQIAHNLKPVFDQLAATFQAQVLPALKVVLAKLREWGPTIGKIILVVLKVVGAVLRFASAILGKVLPVAIRLVAFLTGNFYKAIYSMVQNFAKGVSAAIDFGKKIYAAGQKVVEFAKTVGQKIGQAIGFIKEMPGKIKKAFSNAPTLLVEAGKAIIKGLISGIKAMAKQAADAAIAVVKGALDKAKNFLHIKSPSKKWDYEVGRMAMQGLIDGFNAKSSAAADAAGNAVDKATKKVKEKAAKLRDALSSLKSDFASLAEPIASNFTQGLFDFTDAASFTANLTSVKGTLRTLIDNFTKLKNEGLNAGFLYQLFQQGGPALINGLASLSATDAQATGSLFSDVTSLSDQLATAVAGNTDKGAALQQQTATLTAKLDKLIKHVDDSADRIAAGVNGAASSGRRRAA